MGTSGHTVGPLGFLPVALAVALTGCAAITTGRYQPVSVETTACVAARCELTNQKGVWHVTSTPGSVLVHKAYGDMTVVCQKGGYRSNPHLIPSAVKVEMFGNILIGGLIGATVDASTGAAYDYPPVVSVQMICTGDPRSVVQPPATVYASRTQSTATTIESAPVSDGSNQLSATPIAPAQPSAQRVTPQIDTETGYVPAATGGLTRVDPPQEKPLLPTRKDARYQFNAEQLAKQQGCPQPASVMSFYSPGAETYSVACGDKEPLSVRCEYGNCRILK